jgi:uncharacterized glyoxalase superfamily protein PhnB
MPDAPITPVLGYDDVNEASDWLCHAFGFRVRLRIGSHRVQLERDGGWVVVARRPEPASTGDSLMVRVDDVDAHHDRALAAGARILSPPTDYPYGERQYSAVDIGGHAWTFSQTIADVDPAEWGGQSVDLG